VRLRPSPFLLGLWRVAFLMLVKGTLKGSFLPRSSTEKHVCLSVMCRVPWKAICTCEEPASE
jgi:hypothetical protein